MDNSIKHEKALRALALKLHTMSNSSIRSSDILCELRDIYFYYEFEKIPQLALDLSFVSPEADQSIIEMKRWLRGITIRVPNSILMELTEYGDTVTKIRQRLFGYLRTSNSKGISIDTIYTSLISSYPGYLKEGIGNGADQLREILNVIMNKNSNKTLNKSLISVFDTEIRSRLSKIRVSEEDWNIGEKVSVVQRNSYNALCFIHGVLRSYKVSRTGLSYVIEADGGEYHCKEFDENFVFNELGVRAK